VFKDRSTLDIVVILLTAMVSLTIVLSAMGIIVMRMTHPNVDVQKGADVIGNVIQTVVGALVGFIGGRAVGKLEATNGGH